MIDWMSEWQADPALASIVNSEPFHRLRDISFLGAIDYTRLVAPQSGEEGSRWAHSIGVAELTDSIARSRGYDSHTRRHLVAAALLHDIGHAPLSHSVEPYFKRYLGIGHHELGEYFIDQDEGLSKVLRRHFDVERIKALIAGKGEQEWGGELFDSPINVDTIDGILRSAKRFRKVSLLNPLSVAKAAFPAGSEPEGTAILDQFWELKGQIYTDYITSKAGVLADCYSQEYFQTGPQLTRSWLTNTEKEWHNAFPSLFSTLKTLSGRSRRPDSMQLHSVNYVFRSYLVVSGEKKMMARYQVKKSVKEMAF